MRPDEFLHNYGTKMANKSPSLSPAYCFHRKTLRRSHYIGPSSLKCLHRGAFALIKALELARMRGWPGLKAL